MVINTPAWLTQPTDDTRMNRMSNIFNTGTILAGLDKTKFGLLGCTSTSGGLTIDHLYMCNAAGTGLVDVTGTLDHHHTSATSDGGSFYAIYAFNSRLIDLRLTGVNDVTFTSATVPWIQTGTGSATFESNTDGTTGERALRLRTNATNPSAATISYPHLKLDFSKPALFQTKLRIETFSNIAIHTGVGCDDVTAADSNTRKFQAELCTVTNNNWWLRTANGSAQTASDSGVAGTANRVSIEIEHSTSTDWLYLDGTTVVTKSTNVASTGATADNNLIKHSVKNSTTADRPILSYGSRLVYTISDTWGH